MKKVISLVLVLVMTAALFCTPAFAATYTSKSNVQNAKADEGLIFWDSELIYDNWNDLENRKIIAFSDADVAAALENAVAALNAKKENGKLTSTEEKMAEELEGVKAETLKPLFVKHFRWADPARQDAITFDLKFDGTESSKLIVLYRDWNDISKTASAEQKTLWKVADAAKGPWAGVEAVNRGTVAVFVVAD